LSGAHVRTAPQEKERRRASLLFQSGQRDRRRSWVQKQAEIIAPFWTKGENEEYEGGGGIGGEVRPTNVSGGGKGKKKEPLASSTKHMTNKKKALGVKRECNAK